MAHGYAFVSHDQVDEEGVRAEVYVQKGTGVVTGITPKSDGKVALIVIKTEGLTYPQSSWIQTDAPQYKVLQEALDSNTPVEYRIESQRKLKDDRTKEPILRSTPIQELRVDTVVAKACTKMILVGVNGELTDERLTHPKEDPASAGRRPAEDPDLAKAQATPNNQNQNTHQDSSNNHQGNQGNQNNQGNFRKGFVARESAPWEEFNKDGSLNIGSYKVQAAAGAEMFARKNLPDGSPEEQVIRYAAILLAVADKIQAYVTKKAVDRMASSHTRARSMVYEVVENLYAIPADSENDGEWVANVGRATQARFTATMVIATNGSFDLSTLYANTAAPSAPASAPAPQRTEQPAAPQAPKPPVSQAKSTAKANEPLGEVDNATIESARPNLNAETPMNDVLNTMMSNATSYQMFAPVKIEKVTEQNKMSEDTMEMFKEFVKESEADYGALAKLLQHTFGVSKASEVPGATFEEFLDFYTGEGTENFIDVLSNIDNAS